MTSQARPKSPQHEKKEEKDMAVLQRSMTVLEPSEDAGKDKMNPSINNGSSNDL